jgi:hypothetical protein
MNILPVNLQLIVVFAIFQGCLVLLIIYFFIDKFFSSRKYRLEQALLNETAYKQSIEALHASKVKSQEILSEAEKQASAIITSANLFTEDMKKTYNEAFKTSLSHQEQLLVKTTESLIGDLKDNFGREQITSLAGFTDLVSEFKAEVHKQIEEYRNILTKNSLDTESELKGEMKTYLEEMKKNINEYEQLQRNKLKEVAYNSLVWVNKEFFSSAVSLSDHEELVRKILADASLREKIAN